MLNSFFLVRYTARAQAYFQNESYEQAAADFESALHFAPSDESQENLQRCLRAMHAEQERDEEEEEESPYGVSVASDDIYDNAAANDDLYSDDDGDYGALYTDDALYDEAGGKHFLFSCLDPRKLFFTETTPPPLSII